MPLHLFASSSISLINELSFQHTNLVQIFLHSCLKHFIFLVALKMVLLLAFHFLDVISIYFYLLTYSVNLLNPPINSSCFYVDISENFRYIIMSSLNKDSFICLVQYVTFYFFFLSYYTG